MNRKKGILAIILAAVLISGAAAGCASKKGSMAPEERDVAYTTTAETYAGKNMSMQFNDSAGSVADYDSYKVGSAEAGGVPEKPAANEAQGIRGTGYDGSGITSSAGSGSLDILAQRKVIRNANLSIEVDNFYSSYGNLQAMLTGIGFVQESNIHRDFYTWEGEQKSRISGNITIRVDARHFDNILNDIKGLGVVIDDRIYSTDVTDQFFDTEGRLKILKIEYDYLEEYMRSLKDPDSIFKTRMRMTELQTEIERLTGTLNKWSDLVELSTIYIQMTEKYPDEVTKAKTDTYWDRLKNSVKNSLTGIVDALGDLVIFVIEAIPTLVILGLLALIGFRLYKKYIRKARSIPPEIKNPEDKK